MNRGGTSAPLDDELGLEHLGTPMVVPNCSSLKADFPPAIVFFGTKDKWLKGWDPAFKKMKKLGAKNLDSWTAKEQGHSFFNDQPWADVTIKACDEFLIKHGLLEGSPTLKDPETGEVLTKIP